MPQPFYTRTNGANPAEANKGVWPRFYMDTVPDELESMKQGRRCYKEEERVEVFMPGNNLFVPVFKVTEEHRERWPSAYKAFKDGLDTPVDGTPIEEWPVLNRAQVLELRYLNFRTVEDVAGASDAALQRIGMGGRILRDRAAAFIDDSKRVQIVEQQASELAASQSRTTELEAMVKNMGEQLSQLQANYMRLAEQKPALQTMIPGNSDPFELAKQAVGQKSPATEGSSLANIKPSKRAAKVA